YYMKHVISMNMTFKEDSLQQKYRHTLRLVIFSLKKKYMMTMKCLHMLKFLVWLIKNNITVYGEIL
ncbi:hypothetical protein DUF74_24980, partial [Salmonella enterica]|nr:hypothetical protein [Salmonella enterica]